MISLCNGWEFTEQWSDAFLSGSEHGVPVRLPHNVREVPQHYAAPEDYETVCGYRRKLDISPENRDKRIFLQFDAAAHIAFVYINGTKVCEHRCGYTAFRAEIGEYLNFDGEDTVAVRLDTRENGEIPPFGFVIDYLTYGGLYREVWLDIREKSYIENVFVYTPSLTSAEVRLSVDGGFKTSRVRVMDGDRCLAESRGGLNHSLRSYDVHPWDVEKPKLYTLVSEIFDENGALLDAQNTSFGFRTAEFKADGFYLNGRKLFMRGLNRHQSFPYIGYAAPESLQREDARILREELGCNAVRTSHYPQSRYFIDECDRRGLLVFTELPGWQHIGGDEWKAQAVENVREMVREYRCHPSIVLWGVRINESMDDDEFYARTNAAARELDPSRATTGVRYTQKSRLLEDVYSYNDFSHTGTNPGVNRKKQVTPDMKKALIVSECNGHMFPTKSFDSWQKRQEHALRHARVQNDALASGEHAGCFGWCMFDYPTHKDFGSGDRVCYHGVMDAFRNPKLAAAVYASQSDEKPVLELGCPMDIGDYPAGNVGEIYAFTNADTVELYKNDVFVKSFSGGEYSALRHSPIHIDDTIGALLETQEGYDAAGAKLLRECLMSAARHGLANMPAKDKAKMLYCMLKLKLSYSDGVNLYGKYVGNWGGEATRWRFDAVKDGKVVVSRTLCPDRKLHIEAKVSSTVLIERASYDMAAVRIKILDENSNPASYAQLPLRLEAKGDIELVGPSLVTAEGGMCGTYVRTLGRTGKGTLTVSGAQVGAVEIEFEVRA